MARIINDATVTVEVQGERIIYKAASANLSGYPNARGGRDHTILMTGSTFIKEAVCAEVKGYSINGKDVEEDERKKLIAAHTAAISESLMQAETSRLQEEVMRLEREAEAALQRARSRRKIILAVHNAIQAGMSVEDVTAGMEDGFSGYVHDVFDQVYVLTDLDTVVNTD